MASAICVRALANAGFEPSVAHDGRAAMDMLQSGEFDLVVTDMFMPTMDGLELVRAMRADSRLTRLPVLFLTSASDQDKQAEGYRAGCDSYLVKPVRPLDLVERVSTLLSRALGTGEQLSGAYLQGRLDGMSVGSLLSFLHAQERSGMLRLWRFGAYGEVAVRQGHPLNAMLDGSLKGEDALTAVLGWNAGTFRFERHDVSELESELSGSFAELIDRAELRRRAD
ncbi:MAG: multi-sensor signal transduction histidine kinase [Myxococcaceae bacterium]|nr:multi-sensor signal transduction histidine kinase [Myxococcaceae bacterium]